LTIADCAAFVHLPLVTLVTRNFFGRDFLEDIPQVKPYPKMLGERPAFAKVNEDRKAAQAAAAKK
jgi:glutathione S-transferase